MSLARRPISAWMGWPGGKRRSKSSRSAAAASGIWFMRACSFVLAARKRPSLAPPDPGGGVSAPAETGEGDGAPFGAAVLQFHAGFWPAWRLAARRPAFSFGAGPALSAVRFVPPLAPGCDPLRVAARGRLGRALRAHRQRAPRGGP